MATVAILLVAGVTGSVSALLMFGLAAFVIATVGQELWRGVRARRAMSSDSVPRALVSLVQRNRRRYGGYLVHVGVAVLFAGVAASSAFQDARDVQLQVGQTAKVGGYDVTYVKPDQQPRGGQQRPAGEDQPRGGDARLARRRPVGTLRTERSFFPSADPTLGPVSRFFEGEATSEVGLRAGLRRDVWSAISPSVRDLKKQVAEGDRVFTGAKSLPAEQRQIALAAGARRPHPLLREQPAAGDVPPDRLAAGELDLDRRADRVPGRPDRPLAAAAPRPAAGRRPLRGSRGARARPRVTGPEWTCCWSSWCWSLVVLVVSAPLRRGRIEAVEASESARRAALEAAKEAKYAEIRDAELDHRMGKLSDEDWRAQDRSLRAEAVEILHRIDALGPE